MVPNDTVAALPNENTMMPACVMDVHLRVVIDVLNNKASGSCGNLLSPILTPAKCSDYDINSLRHNYKILPLHVLCIYHALCTMCI